MPGCFLFCADAAGLQTETNLDPQCQINMWGDKANKINGALRPPLPPSSLNWRAPVSSIAGRKSRCMSKIDIDL